MKRYGDASVCKKLFRSTLERKKMLAAKNMKKYFSTPYGKMRARFNAAKSRILNGKTDRWIDKDKLLAIWDSPACGICNKVVRDEEKSIDHVIPVARGGSNELSNLQLAHLSCNQRKNDSVREGR